MRRPNFWHSFYLRITNKAREIFRYRLWVSRIQMVSEQFLDFSRRLACECYRSATHRDCHLRFTIIINKKNHKTLSYNFRNIQNTCSLNTLQRTTHVEQRFCVVFNSIPHVFLMKLLRHWPCVYYVCFCVKIIQTT